MNRRSLFRLLAGAPVAMAGAAAGGSSDFAGVGGYVEGSIYLEVDPNEPIRLVVPPLEVGDRIILGGKMFKVEAITTDLLT